MLISKAIQNLLVTVRFNANNQGVNALSGLGVAALIDAHDSRVGVEALLPVPISYTLVRACQRFSVVICNISIASPTLLAIPAIPPAAATALSHCCCSGFTRPLVLFTSMLVNTAIFCPTISGVIVRLVQPIRSALPLHRPNCTGRPLASRSVPVLLRNRRQLPLLHASRICCWMVCSLVICPMAAQECQPASLSQTY